MTKLGIDRSQAVRPGEELDVGRLEPILRAQIPGLGTPVAVEQFPRGHSNLTYLVRAGERELVLRRPPFGAKAIRSGHDMSREYRLLSRLHAVYAKAPRALFFCDEASSPFGAPFYVMERVQGVILRSGRTEGIASPELRAISEAFVDTLAELHALDYAAAGLGDFGHPQGYVARQVQGWTERYRKVQTEEVAELESVGAWMAANIPRESRAALIHNDYKYDNLVLDPAQLSRVVAVLDWEMATLGDPLADLGTSLGYWVDPDDAEEIRSLPLGSLTLPGNLTRAEVVRRYEEKSGRDAGDMLFYYASALYKVAVIAQQIYYRYRKGFTQDERFAAFGLAVEILARQAARALEHGRISELGP
jgi:aminoglycoside phosphotransferase (APT) family kinase protein